MRRFLASIWLTSALGVMAEINHLTVPMTVVAQTKPSNTLFYTYHGKRIPLNQRPNAIAVAFRSDALSEPRSGTRSGTRGGTTSSGPLYLQLQQDLQASGTRGGGTRGASGGNISIQVDPVGERYALVSFTASDPDTSNSTVEQIQQQPYVESTLPVLSRGSTNENIILPNEIIVSFKPGLSDTQTQAFLSQNQLKILRPLRFSQNRYLVKSTTASGTAVLDVANRLSNQVATIKSATPNFIQSLSVPISQRTMTETAAPKPFEQINRARKRLDSPRQLAENSSFQTALLPLEWHIQSAPLSQCLSKSVDGLTQLGECLDSSSTIRTKSSLPRTDMHVLEAWQHSHAGRGVVVAVLDSLIQWDHPDLIGSVYTVGNVQGKLPGEEHGWDFVKNSPDTRVSEDELAIMRPPFQDSFMLSDADLLEKYSSSVEEFRQKHPNYSQEQLARLLRYELRGEVAEAFHGTWVSGVIAAHPQNGQGVVGVAPNAKILPVRVGGLSGTQYFSVKGKSRVK